MANVCKKIKSSWKIIGLVALLLVIIVIVGLAFSSNSKKLVTETAALFGFGDEGEKYCLTKVCNETASDLLDSMNKSASPCTNFYEYMCSNWHKRNAIPEDSTSTNNYFALRYRVVDIIQKILEDEKSENDTVPLNLARDYYKDCLKMDNDDMTPLINLMNSYGGWPILTRESNMSNFKWYEMVGDISRNFSIAPLFEVSILQDRNPENSRIVLNKPEFISDAKYLSKAEKYPKRMSAYKEYMKGLIVEYAKVAKIPVDMKSIEKDVGEMFEFEHKLVVIIEESLEFENDTNLELTNVTMWDEWLMNVTDGHNLTEISWMPLLEQMFMDTDANFSEAANIYLFSTMYFDELFQLLETTPKNVISNYLHFRTLSGLIYTMPQNLRHKIFEMTRKIYGVTKPHSLPYLCSTLANKHFGFAIGSKYVEKHFQISNVKEVEEFVARIVHAFKGLTLDSQMFDSELRDKISLQYQGVTYCVGAPSWIDNATEVEERYEGAEEANNGTFIEKYIKHSRRLGNKKLTKLSEALSYECNWHVPQTINAYYDGVRLNAEFPAGIIARPFYHSDYPESLNYAGLGSIIGHEVSHAFDSTFFELGWTKYSNETYTPYGLCLINQYESFNLTSIGHPEYKLQGKLSISENFADQGGLWSAWWALKRNQFVTRKSEKKLIGLEDYTPEQLFFMAFGYSQCELQRGEEYLDNILTESHVPERFRLLASLQNFKPFAETFNCAEGSVMNPADRCYFV